MEGEKVKHQGVERGEKVRMKEKLPYGKPMGNNV